MWNIQILKINPQMTKKVTLWSELARRQVYRISKCGVLRVICLFSNSNSRRFVAFHRQSGVGIDNDASVAARGRPRRASLPLLHRVDADSLHNVSAFELYVFRWLYFAVFKLILNLKNTFRWFLPFVGHMGIATSRGIIRDFAGSYYVSVSGGFTRFPTPLPTKLLYFAIKVEILGGWNGIWMADSNLATGGANGLSLFAWKCVIFDRFTHLIDCCRAPGTSISLVNVNVLFTGEWRRRDIR